MAADPVDRAAQVGLLRWLRRQLRQAEPLRERLEAAIEQGDAAEARRIVAQFAFSDTQRRHVAALVDQWAEALGGGTVDDLDPPGLA